MGFALCYSKLQGLCFFGLKVYCFGCRVLWGLRLTTKDCSWSLFKASKVCVLSFEFRSLRLMAYSNCKVNPKPIKFGSEL